MGDYRATVGETPPLTKRERRWRLRFWGVFGLLLVIGLLVAGLLVRMDRYARAAGTVTTKLYAEVRPPSVGTVAVIHAQSGEQVSEGAVLVQLDASAERASLEEAKSRVNQIQAETVRRRAEIEEQKRKLQENIAIAKLRLQNASAKLLRSRELLEKGLVAGSAEEDAKLTEELARAELASLLGRDESIYGKELAVLEQELAARRDVVQRTEAQLRGKEVRAPISGQVLRYEFVIGELVRPETVLYEIFGGEEKVLRLRIEERYATRVAHGQRYTAELAPYRGLQRVLFRGEVLSLRNVIQAEGQRTYRIAYCSFDPQGHAVPPGTSAEAKIYYGSSCLWLYVFGLD